LEHARDTRKKNQLFTVAEYSTNTSHRFIFDKMEALGNICDYSPYIIKETVKIADIPTVLTKNEDRS
jgi:hypothetical protein